MPTYYFHIRTEGRFAEDLDGTECVDFHAARDHALRAVYTYLNTASSERFSGVDLTVEIYDQDDNCLMAIPILGRSCSLDYVDQKSWSQPVYHYH